MISAEDTASVKVAIEICNRPEIKKEILCMSGSDYDKNKGTFECSKKKQWNEIVEKKATVVLDDLNVAKQLQGKVIGIVLLAGMRMLTWAEYHEGTLGLSREYSVNFLNGSFFTQHGIIDNKKAAAELMKDENLNIKQKYKLACLYCYVDRIPGLYKQMTKEDKKEFYDAESSQKINQPGLVKFWSYYLMGEIDKLKGDKSLYQYRLQKAVESGSTAAVEYCLTKTNFRRQKHAVVEAAVEAVRCRSILRPYFSDRIVFRNQRYKDSEGSWVPSDYYMDILCFLFSKMGEDQQLEFLKNDIKGANYQKNSLEDHTQSRVLKYFLNWPYPYNFMEKAKLMWEFLPERNYAVLLLRICDKMKSRKEGSLKYGEERSFDYRELLKKFWCQSPEHFKRYVFSNQEVSYVNFAFIATKACVGLLFNLFTLDNSACEDRENIKLILDSATGQEKENILSSEEWKTFCIEFMKEEQWETVNGFLLNWFLHKEQEDKFKKELCFTNEAKRNCIHFVKNYKWEAAETFIKWSSLPEEEINKLKKEMIYSEDGMHACVNLISPEKKFQAIDEFIRWYLNSEEQVEAFRKELVFSYFGISKCSYLVETDKLELASEFINFCVSSEAEVKELKKKVAYEFGGSLCEDLISDREEQTVHDFRGHAIGTRIVFEGGKWEEVEKFLTWSFSSEEEMSDFKKNVVLKDYGKKIHFNLIESSQWEEAETFFSWLGLSTEEIKKLKKDTLFHDDVAREMFNDLMYSGKGETKFFDYGCREEAIELLLRWYLTDKEAVLEFNDEFKRIHQEHIDEEYEYVLTDFDLMIEQRLRELDKEQMGVKRKSETFTSSKKHCS